MMGKKQGNYGELRRSKIGSCSKRQIKPLPAGAYAHNEVVL